MLNSGLQMTKAKIKARMKASWIWSNPMSWSKESMLHFKRSSTGNPMRPFRLRRMPSRAGSPRRSWTRKIWSTKQHRVRLDYRILNRMSKEFQAKNKALKLLLLKCTIRDWKKPKRPRSTTKEQTWRWRVGGNQILQHQQLWYNCSPMIIWEPKMSSERTPDNSISRWRSSRRSTILIKGSSRWSNWARHFWLPWTRRKESLSWCPLSYSSRITSQRLLGFHSKSIRGN